jgi:hypothetical protein
MKIISYVLNGALAHEDRATARLFDRVVFNA